MRLYGWLGLALLIVSEFFLFLKIEPFLSWFYCFAWWSYILLADNLLLRLRGRSLLTGRGRELAGMLFLSVFIWLVFEAYNLTLRNWAYAGIVPVLWMRWCGYGLAFATVLPGIFITADLMEFWIFGPPRGPSACEIELLNEVPASKPSRLFILLGILLSAAPVLYPRYLFASVWLGPIFLFDPLLEKLRIRSLSLSISAADRRRVWSLLLGGLACGMMWEFWNFWAASKWVYSVPFFGRWKVFEMPVLGFLGFPPFALECWILYHLMREGLRRAGPAALRTTLWVMIGAGCLLIFYCIDHQTVLRFVDPGLSKHESHR
jgi:hypothetical protein